MNKGKDPLKNDSRRIEQYFLYLYTAFLVIISTVTFHPDPQDGYFLFNIPHLDKIIHYIMYFLCSFFFYRSYSSYIGCFLYGSILGFSLEIIQYFLPERHCDLYDMICNTLGSMTFALIIYLKKRPDKTPSNR